MASNDISNIDAIKIGKRSVATVTQSLNEAALNGEEPDYLRIGKKIHVLLAQTVSNSHPNNGIVLPTNNTGFNFEGLPAEIRNEVYRLTLTSKTPIVITHYNRNSRFLKGVKLSWLMDKEAGMHRPQRTSGLGASSEVSVAETASSLWYASYHTPTLLRVSRRINAEALPFLYYENSFIFRSNTALKDFTKECANNRALLRDVTIKKFRPRVHSLEPLRSAVKIQRVSLCITDISTGEGPEGTLAMVVYQALLPFVMGLDRNHCTCGSTAWCNACFDVAWKRRLDAVKLQIQGTRTDPVTGASTARGRPFTAETLAKLKKRVRALFRYE